jgi:hypothetical protein
MKIHEINIWFWDGIYHIELINNLGTQLLVIDFE